MSFLGDFFSPVVGLASGLISSAFQNSATAELSAANQQRQFELNRETMQNKHQWEVDDLRKAGLNPMLSAMNGSTGTLSVGNSAVSGANPDIMGNSAKFAQSFQSKLINAQLDNVQASTDKLNAEASVVRQNSSAEQQLKAAQSGYFNAQTLLANLNRLQSSQSFPFDLNLKKIQAYYAPYVYESNLNEAVSRINLNSSKASESRVHAANETALAQSSIQLNMSKRELNYALSHRADVDADSLLQSIRESKERTSSIKAKTFLTQLESNILESKNYLAAHPNDVSRALYGASEIGSALGVSDLIRAIGR